MGMVKQDDGWRLPDELWEQIARAEKRSAFRRMNIYYIICAESAYGGRRCAFPPYGPIGLWK